MQRGETGTRILYWHFEDRRAARDSEGRPLRDEKGATVYETRALQSPRVYTYNVFNAEQCDGLPPRAEGRRPWAGHPEADRVLQGSGARIEHAGGDRAFYDIRGDRIVLPFRERFPEAAGYYQAALHELGHWTGHASRLNRATLQEGIVEGPYSKQYAREELRAEISSMMTGDRLDLGHDPARSASYVGHWVKALREDSREIYRAARDAQDISDFLMQPERDRVAEREVDRAGGRAGEGARACRPRHAGTGGPRGRDPAARRGGAGGPVPAVPAHARGRLFRAGTIRGADDPGRPPRRVVPVAVRRMRRQIRTEDARPLAAQRCLCRPFRNNCGYRWRNPGGLAIREGATRALWGNDRGQPGFYQQRRQPTGRPGEVAEVSSLGT